MINLVPFSPKPFPSIKSYCYTILSLCAPLTLQATTTQSDQGIFLIGDSVLDNFYWFKDPKQNLTQQLQNQGYANTYNYAVDASQIQYIRNGIKPSQTYVNSRANHGLPPYPINEKGKVKPLDLLKAELTSNEAIKQGYCVISIVGNNIVLGNHASSASIHQALTSLQQEYQEILDSIQHIAQTTQKPLKTILVLPYFPLMKDNVFFKSTFCQNIRDIHTWIGIYQTFFQVLSALARTKKCHIIDLSRTFHPYRGKDYGNWPPYKRGKKTPIEPSNESSQYIADLIHTIIQKDAATPPTIYYGQKGALHEDINDANIHASYAQSLKDHIGTHPPKHTLLADYRWPICFAALVLSLLYYLYPAASSSQQDKSKHPKKTLRVGKTKRRAQPVPVKA